MSSLRPCLLVAATVVACAPDSASKTTGATAEVTPATGPQSGQADLTVTLPDGTRTDGLVDVFLDGELSLRGLSVSVTGTTLALTEQPTVSHHRARRHRSRPHLRSAQPVGLPR